MLGFLVYVVYYSIKISPLLILLNDLISEIHHYSWIFVLNFLDMFIILIQKSKKYKK